MKKVDIIKRIKEINATINLRRRTREHLMRSVTIRTNDGSNQCLGVGGWLKLVRRLVP
jgi:hypothetical protein